MPQLCKACHHEQRPAIDQALVTGSETIRDIGSRYGLTPAAVHRHKQSCVAEMVAKALETEQAAKVASEASQGASLLAKVSDLVADARRLGAAAEKAGDLRAALAAIRELTRLVELMAKLTGELQSGTTVNVAVAIQQPEYSPEELEHLAHLAMGEAEELRNAGALAALPEAFQLHRLPGRSEAQSSGTAPLGHMTGADRGGLTR